MIYNIYRFPRGISGDQGRGGGSAGWNDFHGSGTDRGSGAQGHGSPDFSMCQDVLVDFFAPWPGALHLVRNWQRCGHCRKFEPLYKQLAKWHGIFLVVKEWV